MLKNLNEIKTNPSRTVVLGSEGFVGNHILKNLQKNNISAFGISKKNINLLEKDAEEKLFSSLQSKDTLVIVSAIAPCKNRGTLIENLCMMKVICNVIEKIDLAHLIYISSDAVYHSNIALVTEESATAPNSFHGMMHIARELMLKEVAKKIPLAILRSSLLYGMEDPHDSYGPNQFRRLAEKSEDIKLFGEGEEKRDYIFIEDVAKIVSLVIQHKSEGILNIATGQSYSFKEIAEETIKQMKSSTNILTTPRNNPVIHRHFDIANCYKAFPTFQYTPFKDGLKKILEKMHVAELA